VSWRSDGRDKRLAKLQEELAKDHLKLVIRSRRHQHDDAIYGVFEEDQKIRGWNNLRNIERWVEKREMASS
jgi:hypothetical protein